MVITAGTSLLRGRYELAGPPKQATGDATYWRGWSEDGARLLIKTWSYDGDEPDRVQRALWDKELRTLYKVGSTPGASDTLVVLKDAGLDHEARCFVMVLEAPGYESLRDAVADRAAHPWLANRDSRDRCDIWTALGRTASGLDLLHDQQILHRDVGVEALLFNSDEGAESVRLGGFEWSVRLGKPLEADPPAGWASPPGRDGGEVSAWRPDDDWFGFGMLCTRLLLDVESYAGNDTLTRHQRVLKAVAAATRSLTELERSLLGRLIAADPLERLARPHDILGAIRDIIRLLSAPPTEREDARPYTLVVNPRSTPLTDHLLEQGFREHLELTRSETYNPADVRHTTGLCDFMRRDLDGAALYAVPRQSFVVMVGHRLVLRVGPNRDRNDVTSWQTAFCMGAGELRSSEGGSARVELPAGRLAVRTIRTLHTDRTVAHASAPWDDVMPRFERGAELARELSRFQEFVRATNQIELLLLDATIFPYELVSGPDVQEGRERVVVRERPRAEHRQVLRFFELEKGLEEFLQREMEAGKADGGGVILSGPAHDALMLPGGGKDNQWRVTAVDQEHQTATLERDAFDPVRPPAPTKGFLRGAGMPGQTKLVRRRKQAIDNLDKHSYLLRSLAAPGQVYIDTGASDLPVPLDPEVVDSVKCAAIEDILRVRPIYTLQGPPGTGKTTLVAWLLREILMDDPVAQVLVTAQAHGAVDVLRARVTEAFSGVPVDRRPLAVRLGSRRGDDGLDLKDSVEDVALEVLRGSIAALSAQPNRSEVQDRWLAHATEMADELARHEALGTRANDFVELVKRGANLTYCTTSAGELEALASDQSFDWSIVEEAGKAHGFDLALPLQAGHRWLLIGDHNQLPPYRYEDYLDGLRALDSVVDALQALPDDASNLLDWEWVSTWRERSQEEREEFKGYARDWLKTFKRAFEHCSVAVGRGDAGQQLTTEKSEGAAAGILVGQHRMHPDIGTLISGAYYEDQLVNQTLHAGVPLARVIHGFDSPPGLSGVAIAWLDVPWCQEDPRTREKGPAEGRPRYSNEAEAVALRAFLQSLAPDQPTDCDIAFLSPYSQQVALLRRKLSSLRLPRGLQPKVSLNGRPAAPDRLDGVHTVDSFQGNQADVIVVSLVRNNQHEPGQGMGFLDEPSRLNVLLSRAERLLVLVGSWDFFVHQVSTVQLDDRPNPLWHWKRIVTDLDYWVTSGKAVRLPADLRGLA